MSSSLGTREVSDLGKEPGLTFLSGEMGINSSWWLNE